MPIQKSTRAQRRRMQKLADRVGLITKADRQYFERFPHRRHRVRVAGRAEIEQDEIARGRAWIVPSGRQLYTVVRNVRPGFRLRMMIHGPANADPELFTEAKAAGIYVLHESEEHRAMEAQLVEMFEALK